jgi:hypothetical protein
MSINASEAWIGGKQTGGIENKPGFSPIAHNVFFIVFSS